MASATLTFAYQWLADDAEINGADAASSYTLVADADEGKAITVRVSFTDDAENDEQLTSAATGAVATAPPSPNTPATGLPTISGTGHLQDTLTADTTGISDGDGLCTSRPSPTSGWSTTPGSTGQTLPPTPWPTPTWATPSKVMVIHYFS